MKQIKKILCGILLTSFVILSSVNIFAGPGDRDSSPPSEECAYSETNYMENNESAMDYKTTGSYDLQFEAGHEWGTQNPPPNEPPSSNDINGDSQPDIYYVTIENFNEDWITEEYNCEEGWIMTENGLAEIRCTAEAIEDPDPAIGVIDGAPKTKDEITRLYNDCDAVDFSITYFYKYEEMRSHTCAQAGCTRSCSGPHTISCAQAGCKRKNCSGGHTISCSEAGCPGPCNSKHEWKETFEGSTYRTYHQATGSYLYGNVHRGMQQRSVDTRSYKLFGSTQEANDYINAIMAADFQYSYDNYRYTHDLTKLKSTQAVIDETAIGHLGDYGYYIFNNQKICMYYARQEIIGLIVENMIKEGYFNIGDEANNAYIRNGCRTYAMNKAQYNKKQFSDRASSSIAPAEDKLHKYYKANDLYLKDNNLYGILFPGSQLIAVDVNSTDTVLDIPVNSYIWHDSWNPATIKFEEHIVYAEMVESSSANGVAYKDVTIGRDNGSVDVYLQNLTHPDSYYGKAKHFPLNKTVTGFNNFSAIRATYNGKTDNLVYPYPDGTGFGFKLNEGQSVFFNSGVSDQKGLYGIQGDNLIIGKPYADIYKQRLFRVNEHKNVFAYMVTGNKIFDVGEYIGINIEPTLSSDTCEYTWRALFNIYMDENESSISYKGKLSPYKNKQRILGMNESYAYTQEMIYSTMPDETCGLPIGPFAEGFTYKHKDVRTDVQSLLTDKVTHEVAFQDIIKQQATLTQLMNAQNQIRNAIFLNSQTAGKIYFEDGLNVVDYKIVPDHIKPVKTYNPNNGMLKSYSIEGNGIYVLAQSQLPDTYTALVQVPYNTTTTTTINNKKTIVEYTICIGQHNCNCEDINVLCECQDEIAGCPKPDICEEDPTYPGCENTTDCTENPNAPECGCFDGEDGGDPGNQCNCPDYMDPEDCDLWSDKKPDLTCIDSGKPCVQSQSGGITGGGSEDYFDEFYDPSSTITN